MKYQGKITDPKDLVTKEYTDNKIASTSNILKGDGTGKAVAATQVETSLLGIDSAPTTGSSNLVTSGGVYTAIGAKYTKPSGGIPASDLASGVVNNATLTIQKNGTTINTFTANSSENKTVNITVPTTPGDLSITEYTAAEVDTLFDSIA